jgi:hypothetical protein
MSICLAAVLLAACAVMGSTPEAQAQRGAQTHAAASRLTYALLQRNKITTAQAQQYTAMLDTANAALEASKKTLIACRATTVPVTGKPDPCQQTVSADTGLALSILTEIEKTLQAQSAK